MPVQFAGTSGSDAVDATTDSDVFVPHTYTRRVVLSSLLAAPPAVLTRRNVDDGRHDNKSNNNNSSDGGHDDDDDDGGRRSDDSDASDDVDGNACNSSGGSSTQYEWHKQPAHLTRTAAVDEVAVWRAALRRRNSTHDALGSLRRRRFVCGYVTLYMTPDSTNAVYVTALTVVLLVCNVAVLWPMVSAHEVVVGGVLVLLCVLCNVAIACTDPGVYPRLRRGEVDTLAADTSLVYCRICCVRRLPHTAHCYTCGVCVRDHDHHCAILGGCVGARNLRWFTLYTLLCTTAACMGVCLHLRFLYMTMFRLDHMTQPRRVYTTTTTTTTTTTSPSLSSLSLHEDTSAAATSRVPPWPSCEAGAMCDYGVSHVASIVLLLLDTLVAVLLGVLSGIYVWFACTSRTLRVSRRLRARPRHGQQQQQQQAVGRQDGHTHGREGSATAAAAASGVAVCATSTQPAWSSWATCTRLLQLPPLRRRRLLAPLRGVARVVCARARRWCRCVRDVCANIGHVLLPAPSMLQHDRCSRRAASVGKHYANVSSNSDSNSDDDEHHPQQHHSQQDDTTTIVRDVCSPDTTTTTAVRVAAA